MNPIQRATRQYVAVLIEELAAELSNVLRDERAHSSERELPEPEIGDDYSGRLSEVMTVGWTEEEYEARFGAQEAPQASENPAAEALS